MRKEVKTLTEDRPSGTFDAPDAPAFTSGSSRLSGDTKVEKRAFRRTAMNNDSMGDRRKLIEELQRRGIEAYEYTSGGGIMHVAADLHKDGDDLLQVATGSAETDCEVVLLGWRGDYQVGNSPQDWYYPATVEEAATSFEDLRARRDELIDHFRAGELNV